MTGLLSSIPDFLRLPSDTPPILGGFFSDFSSSLGYSGLGCCQTTHILSGEVPNTSDSTGQRYNQKGGLLEKW